MRTCAQCGSPSGARVYCGQKCRSRAHYERNRDAYIVRAAEWSAAHPDETRDARKGYRARLMADPVRLGRLRRQRREAESRRRKQIEATAAAFTAADLAARWLYYGGKCWLCGAPADQWDHVKPLSKGGVHMLANLRPACEPCNRTKAANWPLAPSRLA